MLVTFTNFVFCSYCFSSCQICSLPPVSVHLAQGLQITEDPALVHRRI